MKKNPTLKWGIAISVLYVIFIKKIWLTLSEVMIYPAWLFFLVTASILVLPSLIAYAYDKEKNHPKYYAHMEKLKEEKETRENKTNNYMEKYNLFNKEKNMFPAAVLDFNNYKNLKLENEILWTYKENENLCFVAVDYSKDIGKIEIPMSKIYCFSRLGDLNSYTKITGGGGGGSSIKRAIIGGVIAGGAGAIIASRNKTEEIKSEHVVEDNRKTVLQIEDNGNMYYLTFKSDDYDSFLKLIPDKEISFLNNKSNIEDDIYEKIRKLSKLKDEGILTEEEFSNKKKEFLEKLI